MGKDKKKKGQGAAKTALKTEKKGAKKLKKELEAKGEEDIETLIAKFTTEDKKSSTVSEEVTDPPSRRSSFVFQSHPEKEELILFGGEFFNGVKTFMYNDLYTYNIKKNEWTLIKTPVSPPPRCAHQAVCLSQEGGQLWTFGGEFASPTQSQFYHYKDLWVYHMQSKKWEKVNASRGPSARSGHRMCLIKRNIFVFGGYHDNLRDYKYYNDVHIFNLDTYSWTKLDTIGNGPSPRSACQLTSTSDGKLIVYGGYSKIKNKKESDSGIAHCDMFSLHQDNHDQNKWKWMQVKQSGLRPSPRSGFSLTKISDNKVILFGGVHDEEDDDNDEELCGNFFNDLYQLEVDKGQWLMITLKSKEKTVGQKKARRRKKVTEGLEEEEGNKMAVDSSSSDEEDESLIKKNVQDLSLNPPPMQDEEDVFKVTIGPQSQANSNVSEAGASCDTSMNMPHPRMNAACTFKVNLISFFI
ncbi:Kelch domain-containing protein 4 [Nymphon striatum]|nr:Kelch domain-containing protein 4 [Nymphon striatum]